MWVVKEELKSEEVMCPWTAFLRIPDSPDPPEGSSPPGGALCPPKRAGLELLGAGVGAPLRRAVQGAGCAAVPRRSIHRSAGTSSRGHSAARAPRAPARRRVPSPAPAARPRRPRGGGKFAPGRSAPPPPPPPRPSHASAPGRPGRGGGRAARACGPLDARAPKGRPPPPHPGQVCAGRRSSRAARRAAPRASAALLPRRPLPARSPPDTDAAFSCRRISLEPPRLLRKKGKRKTVRRPAEQRPAPAQPSECGAAQLDCEPYRSETLPQACLAPGTQRPQQVAGQLEGRRGRNTVELLSGAQAEASGMARRPHRRAASHTLSGQRSVTGPTAHTADQRAGGTMFCAIAFPIWKSFRTIYLFHHWPLSVRKREDSSFAKCRESPDHQASGFEGANGGLKLQMRAQWQDMALKPEGTRLDTISPTVAPPRKFGEPDM
ncbi:uncharacterized protein LOC141575976 [Camelus bactrianus]|uniref:Uncharacterized protein LOC141575976 n=1 Tax=Camelus bactrianus TaxID=9837 RepID=A0AC58PVM4_CAMBA